MAVDSPRSAFRPFGRPVQPRTRARHDWRAARHAVGRWPEATGRSFAAVPGARM